MNEPELFVPARERSSGRGIGLALSRLWFALGVLFVGYWMLGALSHLGERQARDWFDMGLFGGLAWWGVWWAMAWIARSFRR